ncbi:MAG: M20/M25/M40 family metallo-hydrolase [Candidatus Cryptobacteroides sp.]
MKEELKKLSDDSVSLLREMIEIPSPSFEEEKVCTHICKWLSGRGISAERIGNNIICELIADKTRPTLMLCAHIDTVSPATDYSFNPYRPDISQAAESIGGRIGRKTEETEIIPGLGSNDDGASAVAMIAVFRYFSEISDKDKIPNLTLVLSCEEERSGSGGMKTLWGKRLSRIEYAIIGEPTGMKAATSERGLLVIDAVSEGISGHAARNEGVNAIYIALEDIGRLRGHRFDRISPSMGEVHLNVTQINAGSAHNVIPDRCSFVIDIRPTEQYDNEEIFNQLQGICRSTLTPRNLANRSSATRPGSPLLEAASACGIETFSSPTTSDWMRISCDAIKMGPGDSARSHRKDEFIFVREIEEAITGYIGFIENFRI